MNWLDACRSFPLKAGRRVTFEYVMLAGINDSDEDALRLIRLMRGLKAKLTSSRLTPTHCRLTSGPTTNAWHRSNEKWPKPDSRFFVRTTRGDDIDAACGMLGGEKLQDVRGQDLVRISS